MKSYIEDNQNLIQNMFISAWIVIDDRDDIKVPYLNVNDIYKKDYVNFYNMFEKNYTRDVELYLSDHYDYYCFRIVFNKESRVLFSGLLYPKYPRSDEFLDEVREKDSIGGGTRLLVAKIKKLEKELRIVRGRYARNVYIKKRDGYRQ